MGLAGKFVSTSSLLSLARVTGALAGFATQVVLARTLHANALGVFYSVTSFAAVVGLIAAHGYPMIAPRFMLARALFGPSAPLLTVIGAQKENAALAVAALVVLGVLGVSNLVLAPLYGVLGAAIAVAIATLFWLIATAVVLHRLSGMRADAIFLVRRFVSLRREAA
jgi:O-antigen/teichoic acid export membrane protein